MKVLSLTTIYPNEVSASEGRSVASIDRALSQMGVEGLTVVLRPWAPRRLAQRVEKWKHLAVVPRVEHKNGVTLVYARYAHLPRRQRLDLSFRSMARRAGQVAHAQNFHPDVIHAQTIFLAPAASILARLYQVPFIVTLRDSITHLGPMLETGGPGLRRQFEDVFREVSGIFGIGPALVKDVAAFVPAGRKIPILLAPNGVEFDEIDKNLAGLPPRPPTDGRQIVSVAHLFRYKGIFENLAALKLLDERGLRDWRYTIVGEGPYAEDLRAEAARLGLADRVEMTGRLPYPEALRRIRDADIFCLPSFAEAFGNVYAEAAVCSRPAIGCFGQGAEVMIEHERTGLLVPTKDVPAIADALARLLSNPTEGAEMGRRAREHIREFTWARTCRIYLGVLEELVAAKRAGAPVPSPATGEPADARVPRTNGARVRPIRVLFTAYADADNTNAQSLNAREIARRLDPTRFISTLFYERSPAATVVGLPHVRLLKLPPRLGAARMLAEALSRTDLIFKPGFQRFAVAFFSIPEPLRRHVKSVEWIEADLKANLVEVPGIFRRDASFVLESTGRHVAITEFTREKMRLGYGLDASLVIPVGVDTTLFVPPSTPRAHARPTVLFVGHLIPRKGPQHVLDAAARLPHARFVLVGAGREGFEKVIRQRIVDEGLTNVEILAPRTQPELIPIMWEADLLMHPSTTEGLPKTVLEAQATGLPGVIFDSYRAPAVVDGETGFQVKTPAEMIARVTQLVEDSAMRVRMGARAVEHARDFDWRIVVGRWERVFEEMVGS